MSQVNLSKLSNEELVLEYRKGNQIAFNKLIEKNNGLIQKITGKFITVDSISGYDDLYQEGLVGLFKAVNSFNSTVKFSTYAYKVIHNELSNYTRKHVRQKNNVNYTKYSLVSINDYIPNTESLTYAEIISYDSEQFETPFYGCDIDLRADIMRVLETFPQMDKYMFMSYSKGNDNYESIGELYNMTGNEAKYKVDKIKKRLRAELEI